MDALRVGDEVRTGEAHFEPVVFFSRHWAEGGGWTRNDAQVRASYLNITLRSGATLPVSTQHLLFTCGGKDRVAAGKVAQGDVLVDTEQGCSVVTSVTPPYVLRGAYSPMTASGAIVVNDVLASCYTEQSWVSEDVAQAWFGAVAAMAHAGVSTNALAALAMAVDYVGGLLELGIRLVRGVRG
jgi:hypothetical protein